ncbi:DUF4189 domain-containing protein [Luteimonas sp. Y-2-2-4F]|nr:DUF4189 domain-containing protein [Luteimonas sp. Y-2-2-4F]MCD9032066.1 DUF4189 domain-containing protein [Luteimonas sp. Y-2-2-4F]
MLALAACAGSAGAQDPNSAQGRQQAHTAEMNRLGWLQSQQAAQYVSAEEAAAQQAAAEAASRRDARVRRDQQRDWWGVVTVNTADGSWNIALNGADQGAMMRQAMRGCDGTCWPVVAFANTCMAPAYSAQGGMFWAGGESKEEAYEAASRKCSAAGGRDCATEDGQAACTGWKYAYSRMERLNERLNLVAIGRNGRPAVEFYPGAEEYVAKPPESRGESTAIDFGENGPGGIRMAQPWTAIAVPRGGGMGVGMHLGVSRQDAVDTAVQKCGEPNCELLLAFTSGQCAAAVIAPAAGGSKAFGAVNARKEVAAQEATATCTANGETQCLAVFNDCM